MRRLIACSIVALLSTHALAADSKDQVAVYGVGAIFCGKYLDAWDKGNNVLKIGALTWTQGFLTAINLQMLLSKQNTLKFTEPEQINAYMQKYCRDNPLKDFYSGAYQLALDQAQPH